MCSEMSLLWNQSFLGSLVRPYGVDAFRTSVDYEQGKHLTLWTIALALRPIQSLFCFGVTLSLSSGITCDSWVYMLYGVMGLELHSPPNARKMPYQVYYTISPIPKQYFKLLSKFIQNIKSVMGKQKWEPEHFK